MGVRLGAFVDQAQVREVRRALRPLIVRDRDAIRTVIAKLGWDGEQSDVVAITDQSSLDLFDEELEPAPDAEVGLGDRDAEPHGAIGGRRATIA
jgi:hypothetical protein